MAGFLLSQQHRRGRHPRTVQEGGGSLSSRQPCLAFCSIAGSSKTSQMKKLSPRPVSIAIRDLLALFLFPFWGEGKGERDCSFSDTDCQVGINCCVKEFRELPTKHLKAKVIFKFRKFHSLQIPGEVNMKIGLFSKIGFVKSRTPPWPWSPRHGQVFFFSPQLSLHK